ncbi:CD2 antigen cytoplasmic tail-binding protein 2 homolog [Phlebotomus argentipes]|uniref:CD2 antigen cytoplasmic tail-binding protein 2 homolog n=1 Tax=Phlebotomus argentipes TaxID=94469 RepID=UPI0028932B69|nr:CD2 antigen cytoplasmic tail-binding protein 2 homolog [Phlebotomus argentipes]
MSKRDSHVLDDGEGTAKRKSVKISGVKKHTLDSDEEETDDEEFNVLDENDIEGEEEGVAGMDGETKLTPFNMKEEMEEGHFDRDGHYVWNKNKEITDNWLDNIDWVKVQQSKDGSGSSKVRTLGDDSSDSEAEEGSSGKFDVMESYRKILELMQPGESVKKSLQRLGKGSKISSAERWRRKKAGIKDEAAEVVTKLTQLTNDILTRTGNMNIYEETYEFIQNKVRKIAKPAAETEDDALDMYADDFDSKEKSKLGGAAPEAAEEAQEEDNAVKWEFKWKPDDTEMHGPFSTEQMHKWNEEGYFKSGVLVRKVGEDTKFYTSNRIDFDLYL